MPRSKLAVSTDLSGDQETVTQAVIDRIHKQYGVGAIRQGDDAPTPINVVPTGALSLDLALGIGGIPRGRITEIYGPESCLTADTRVHYTVRAAAGYWLNQTGGTLHRLYERFQRSAASGTTFTVPAMTDAGAITRVPVGNVTKNGRRAVYELRTRSGQTIRATANHPFFTGRGYTPLEHLREGDTVYVHTAARSGRGGAALVKYHPTRQIQVVDGCVYRRLPLAHLAYEAATNGMTLDEYRYVLNTASESEIDALWHLPRGYHVHHINEDLTDNRLENLELVASPERADRAYRPYPDTVVAIRYAGVEEVYDIHCAAPQHNFVANNLVVHNSGKTTLLQHIIAQAQKEGGQAAFIDVEHALDPLYAQTCGVNMGKLWIAQPDTGEEALEIASALVSSHTFAVVALDSVAALVPRAELEGDMGDAHVGLQARLMSQALRKLAGTIDRSNTAMIFTNQLRMKIGIMFGNPETTPGGRALKFFASVRIDVRRKESIKKGDQVVGARTSIKVVKNKLAAAFKQTELDILYDEGISRTNDTLDLGVSLDVVQKGGAYFSYQGQSIGQGREKARDYLLSNPEILEEIEDKIRAKVSPKHFEMDEQERF